MEVEVQIYVLIYVYGNYAVEVVVISIDAVIMHCPDQYALRGKIFANRYQKHTMWQYDNSRSERQYIVLID